MGQSLRRACSLSLSLPFVCLFLSVLLTRDAETILRAFPTSRGVPLCSLSNTIWFKEI